MKTKIIFIFSLFLTFLNATTIQTDKALYDYGNGDTTIQVSFTDMNGSQQDWVGIYPAGASYEFENVVAWKWTGGVVDGSLNFNLLDAGEYDARAFFNNSLTKEAEYTFSIIGEAPVIPDVNLTTDKTTYLNTETITANFKYMQGNATDWIGIYPAGASYEFENVIAYKQTGGDINGSLTFEDIPVGDYDVRAFFNNSLTKQASTSISVITDPNYHEVELTLNKNIYAQNELVYVNYNYMKGNQTDWIGIYPAGASYDFANVIDWKYTKGNIEGEMSLGGFPGQDELKGFTPMPGLEAGDYEIRAFFNNSLSTVKVQSFTVTEQNVTSTMYEDANGSISPDWIHVSGIYPPAYYNGVVRLRARWVSSTTNTSEYTLPFDTPNSTQNVLELDVGGVGRWTPHFSIGVIVQTTDGHRRMLWDSYLNHYNVKANKQGNVLSFPTYVELQRNTANSRKHFRVNVDKYLKILEPNNKVISISAFFATGGDLDNIKLSSH